MCWRLCVVCCLWFVIVVAWCSLFVDCGALLAVRCYLLVLRVDCWCLLFVVACPLPAVVCYVLCDCHLMFEFVIVC